MVQKLKKASIKVPNLNVIISPKGLFMTNVICNIYYVNIGEGEHRCWEDFKDFGFMSAGQDPKYSKSLSKLQIGDKVIAYLKGSGFVGVGLVKEQAVPANEFIFSGVTLKSHKMLSANFFENSDNEKSEYLVKIDWLAAYNRSYAKWKAKSGLFTTPMIVASLANQLETIEFVEVEFGIGILSESEKENLKSRSNNEESSLNSNDDKFKKALSQILCQYDDLRSIGEDWVESTLVEIEDDVLREEELEEIAEQENLSLQQIFSSGLIDDDKKISVLQSWQQCFEDLTEEELLVDLVD